MELTQNTPADVRERVARECVEEAERLGRWYGDGYAKARRLLREAAALLLTPRGDEEAWRAFLDALDEFEAAAASLWADPEGPTAEDMERLDRARQRVIECARALAALRSEAQGRARSSLICETCGEEIRDDEEMVVWQDAYTHQRCTPDDSEAQGEKEDALDLIRWAETRGAVLEPVAGNVMPPGAYACYVEGVGDDPAEYEDAGEPYMGPGILGAIRAARRGDGGGA